MLNSFTSRHPGSPNLEHRVSLHQPMKPNVGDGDPLVPDGAPWVVIETFIRQTDGSWAMVASQREGAFNEQVADVARLIDFIKPEVKPVEETFSLTRRADAPPIVPQQRRVIVASDEP